MGQLNGRTAWITGAGTGIGEAARKRSRARVPWRPLASDEDR